VNGKTAKLLTRYSRATGVSLKDLKRDWYSMTAKERFLKRQVILKELKK